jgi:SAM-dependent methyltransferase
MSNQKTYDSKEVVRAYTRRTALQAPEKTILDLLRHQLPGMRMLDLGIGAGRTTLHFAPLVRAYLGTDVSPNMIRAAQRRFPARADALRVCDARCLGEFPERSFDFILFSYNGIDYVDHDGRLAVLREVRRVAADGAYFCFSTHNLRELEAQVRPRDLSLQRPLHSARQGLQTLMLWLRNGPAVLHGLERREHAIVRDLPSLRTYYIAPEGQITQLGRLGFIDIRVFSLEDGRELPVVTGVTDPWLYYLCNVRH